MPSSFSRFLDDEELQKVRELYLQSLEDDGETPEGESPEPANTPAAPQPGTSADL
ncbi:hypothetical protein SAMN05216275_10681 [Streptosporangium canum]|uniref:Uncharacterized protein n=1 Tax=Streptosporangium canum TaxID=324952 RepID=A0A1I3N1A8_9ACTN|nr:hypothetical protein SAMN05216275_10681 [Streptosporangium canum]